MEYKIHSIQKVPHLIDEVIALGDSQRATLGFLADAAFRDYADKNRILVAVSKEKQAIGYVLFARKQNLICRLAHVCVHPEWRKHGVAAALIEELKKQTSQMRCITLRCKRDYNIDPFWEKNGFKAVDEMPGKAPSSTLTVWRHDLQPTLLSLLPETDKFLAVLDLNIVIGVHEDIDSECKSILEFTYADEIDYRISDHCFTEVNRSENNIQRDITRSCLKSFNGIEVCPSQYIIEAVVEIIGENNRDDACQIASAIYNEANCFITKDSKLLNSASDILNKFGIHIYNPTEFIVNYCNESGKDLYFPSSLPQTEIKFVPINDFNQDQCFRHYRVRDEKKHAFRDKLTLNSPNTQKYSKIEIDDEEVGIYHSSVEDDIYHIHLLRLNKLISHKHTINTHIIEKIIQGAIKSGAKRINVLDDYCDQLVVNGLRHAGFIERQGILSKPVEKGFITAQEAYAKAEIGSPDVQLNHEELFELEKLLWPAKIEELEIPTYMVPIKPKWASRLITSQGFMGSLFGTNDIIFQTRRVYYRSSRNKSIQPPGRIIWYTSANEVAGLSKCAIAVSMIDEVEIAPVKKLFSKYKRFGVYTWHDIITSAKNNPDKEMMAITFSKTEVFEKKIKLNDLEKVIHKCEDRNLLTVSPFKISPNSFKTIYELGFK